MGNIQKKLNITSTKKIIILVGVILLAALITIIVLFGTKESTKSFDPSEFTISNQFECKINGFEIIFDDNNKTDNLSINMTVKNIGDDEEVSVESEEIDENVPSINDLSDEEKDKLSEDELNKINKKDLVDQLKEQYSKKNMANYVDIFAKQNDRSLHESEIQRNNGANNNIDSFNPGLKHNESQEVELIFQLIDQSNVELCFNPHFDGQDNSQQIVNFYINGLMSDQMQQIKEKQGYIQKDNSETQTIDFQGIQVKLVDGWYVSQKATVAMKLENSKYNASYLEFSYNSSQDASQIAKSTAQWSHVEDKISQKNINGINYYYYEQNDESFTLCADLPSNSSLRIVGQKISLDNALSIINNINYP